MRKVRCDGCDYTKYGDGDQGIHKSTEQPAAKTIQERHPFQQLHE